MDSLVTQWKVDIRPDSPIINMNQGRVTMANMFWLRMPWQVVTVITNSIKMLSK